MQRKDGKVNIDQTLCNACGLCAGLCPKECMEGTAK
ncbi:MAG: 4Fe-4S binding protein [Christensenellales bacterium]